MALQTTGPECGHSVVVVPSQQRASDLCGCGSRRRRPRQHCCHQRIDIRILEDACVSVPANSKGRGESWKHVAALMPRQALTAAAAHGCTARQPPQTLRPCTEQQRQLLHLKMVVWPSKAMQPPCCVSSWVLEGARSFPAATTWTTGELPALLVRWRLPLLAGQSRSRQQHGQQLGAAGRAVRRGPALHSHNQPPCSQLPSTVFMLYSRSVASSKGRW